MNHLYISLESERKEKAKKLEANAGRSAGTTHPLLSETVIGSTSQEQIAEEGLGRPRCKQPWVWAVVRLGRSRVFELGLDKKQKNQDCGG